MEFGLKLTERVDRNAGRAIGSKMTRRTRG